MVIVDGMNDEHLAEDYLPILQRIKRVGAYGIADNQQPQRGVDTLNCVGALLGLDVSDLPVGRAYLEAVAENIALKEDDCVYRASLLKTENGLLQTVNGLNLSTMQYRQAWQSLKEHLPSQYQLYPLREGRGILIDQKGRLQKTFPPHQHLAENMSTLLPKDIFLQNLIFSSSCCLEFLQENKGQWYLWLWDGAQKQKMPAFQTLHGFQGAIVAKTPVIVGLAKTMQMALAELKKATGETDTDLLEKKQQTIALAARYDLVICHVNGADEAAHRFDCIEKKQFLERVAEELLLPLVSSEKTVLIVGDHSTFCACGTHGQAKQPFYLANSMLKGNLGQAKGQEVIKLLQRGIRHG